MSGPSDEELIAPGLPPRGGALFWRKGGDAILASTLESMRAESSQHALATFIAERFPYAEYRDGGKHFTARGLRDAVRDAGVTFVPSHGGNRGERRELLPEVSKVLANFSGTRAAGAARNPPWLHRVDYRGELAGWQGRRAEEAIVEDVDGYGRKASEFGSPVIVHNQVRHGRRTRSGVNGFRWWFAETGAEGLESCDCGWRSTPHYRVRRPNLSTGEASDGGSGREIGKS